MLSVFLYWWGYLPPPPPLNPKWSLYELSGLMPISLCSGSLLQENLECAHKSFAKGGMWLLFI